MSDETQPAIEFTNVSRWYGDTVALADVSFTIGPGVTGLLGHNGAGKSTALRLCGGFSTPSAGSVRVLGMDPRRTPDVYRRMGIVPDHSPPWPFLTAREVVTICARLRGMPDSGGRRRARDHRGRPERRRRPARSAGSRTGCGSASSWRRRWRTIPTCCCWTSR